MRQIDTIVLVKDIEVSKRFYLDTFKLEVLHDWGSMMVFHNRFAIHQADLLKPETLMKDVLAQGKLGSGNLIIYLELEHESIEACYERLKDQGVAMLHEIVELPWQKIFRVYDPDGHIIEIGSPQKM